MLPQLSSNPASTDSIPAINSFVPAKNDSYATWLPANKGKVLEIRGSFERRQGHMVMLMSFNNLCSKPLHGFAIQLNKNRCGAVDGCFIFTMLFYH